MAKAGHILRDPTWKYYQPLKFLLKCEKVRLITGNSKAKRYFKKSLILK